HIKLSDQINSYISINTSGFYGSKIDDENVAQDDSDDEGIIPLSSKYDEDLIRSDQLWTYLSNIESSNVKLNTNISQICFFIPCSNSYME
ncbi:unnamed protein product, partial [Rotaria magnacalcarata]